LGNRIERFSKAARVTHWIHSITFFLLLITGLTIFVKSFGFLNVIFGGAQGARLIHRIAAVLFIIFPIYSYLVNRKAANKFLKEVSSFDKDNIEFIKAFPKEFLGLHPKVPQQGKFNGGEKINSLLTIISGVLFTCSGLIMWFPEVIPAALVQVSYLVHDLATVLCGTAIFGHVYLALLHPGSKEAINGMTKGNVSEEFAKSHYGKWYMEVKGKAKN
jgi:formate dehydrogenase subunit gamma